jgi:hypothetical protein
VKVSIKQERPDVRGWTWKEVVMGGLLAVANAIYSLRRPGGER